MSGAHCSEKKLEGVWCHSLLAPSIPALLQQYQHLLQQLLGPRAGTTLVHHSGGLDTFVNSSRELVKRVQPHHPCIKFINCLMEAQNSAYGCLGLYVGVLCSSLLKELLLVMDSCDEGLSQRAVKEATNFLMAEVVAYLDANPENLVSKLDLSNLDQMLALVATTLGTKNLGLNGEEKQHLKVKIIEAFLAIIPCADDKGLDAFGDVIVTVVEGRPATEAEVFEGVLYREPDPSVRVIQAIKHRIISSHLRLPHGQFNTSISGSNSNEFLMMNDAQHDGYQNLAYKNVDNSMITNSAKPSNNAFGRPNSPRVSNRLAFSKYSRNILDHENLGQQRSSMKVVLFNVPLVFEQSETECLKFTGGGASNAEVYDTVMVAKLRQLVRLCGVDVIACQKVVSDVIKFELQRDGVLVLERLGTALTNSLQRLTGCVIISDVAGLPTPLEEIGLGSSSATSEGGNARTNQSSTGVVDTSCDGFVGSLTNISVVDVGGKAYLQLENSQQRTNPEEVITQEMKYNQGVAVEESPVVTFLLPALSPVTSDSLKCVVEESLRVLRHAALHPLVAAAGGCFEAALARWVTTRGLCASTRAESRPHDTTTRGLMTDRSVPTEETVTTQGKDTTTEERITTDGRVTTDGRNSTGERASTDGRSTTDVASTTGEEIRSCSVAEPSLPSKLATGDHASNSSENDAAPTALTVEEVLAAVDGLLLDQDGEAAVTERQLRQVARVFAKVFANLSVLLSGGITASSFDFTIDTRTSHLLHGFPTDVSSLVSSTGSASDDNSSLVKCSCRCAVPTLSKNSSEPPFVDLRSVYEIQPGLSRAPCSANNKVDPVHSKSFNGENVSNNKVDPKNSKSINGESVPSMKVVDPVNTKSFNDEKVSGEINTWDRTSANYVFNVTADGLVESYHAKVNAIRLAFEGVVQLLGVDYCVFDR